MLRRPSILVAGGGTLAALGLWVATLLFLNPPQCPYGFTQEQVDASDCIIGANIGIGLVLMLIVVLWGASVIVAVGLEIAARRSD